jgi:hypothetical protein
LTARILGHYQHGVIRFFLGEFVAARALFEQRDKLDDPAHRAVYTALTAEHPYALTSGKGCWIARLLTQIAGTRVGMLEKLSTALEQGKQDVVPGRAEGLDEQRGGCAQNLLF